MKLLFPHFIAPVALAALSVVAGCSSTDNPAASGGAGSTSSGGAAAGGKAGSTSSGGGSSAGAGGTSAGGSAGSLSAGGGAGSLSAGGSAGSLSAAGSAGTGTAGGSAVEASFATVKKMITMKCSAGSGCHTETGNPLQMPDNAALYTKVTTHTTMNCGMLVNKAMPAQSALVKILQGDCGTPPKTTPRMPFQACIEGDTDVGPDAPCIAPDTIAAILSWITKGAPQQ